MARTILSGFVLAVFYTAVFAQVNPKPIPEKTLREAAAKSLSIIQQSQETWYDKEQTCTSCHHQTLPILIQANALDRGVTIDLKFVWEVAGKSFAYLKDLDAVVQGINFIDDVDESWKLLAAHAAGVPPNHSTSAIAQYLASSQQPDGGWQTMDARPPQSSGRFTVTATCARAVSLYMPKSMADEKKRALEKAWDWLAKATPRSTEDRAFQLLGLLWTGANEEIRQTVAKQLIAEQHADGGWSQLPKRKSDAYSTGEVLFALRRGVRLPIADPVYQRGLKYLLDSQYDDGSWWVESRLKSAVNPSPRYFSSGFPHGRHHQYISIMGTEWATQALLEAIPPDELRLPPGLANADFAPAEQDAWISIVLNGSLEELKRALENGLSPDAKTAHGTTALMLAARQPAKVDLLIARGANVNARAESGVDVLTIASRYHGNGEVIRALLKARVAAKPAKGVTVKNDMTPLFNAVACGDRFTAKLLIDAGADVEAMTHVLGTIRQTPLVAATLRNDALMVELLLSHRANPNRGANDIMPLHYAVIGNHLEAVKSLLKGYTRIDETDGDQSTPLHYAASVDPGDTRVLEALLAAGANRALKDKNGRTALELAKEYNHAAAVVALSK